MGLKKVVEGAAEKLCKQKHKQKHKQKQKLADNGKTNRNKKKIAKSKK